MSLLYSVMAESEITLFLLGLETFLELSTSFSNCQGADKERLLESAEQTLRDVVYLEPILPDSDSLLRAVNEVVSCMREECESMRTLIQECHFELRGRGRPRFIVSKEQLVFLLDHGFSQTEMAKMLGCSARTVRRRRRITDYHLQSYIEFSDIDNQLTLTTNFLI